MLRGLAVWLLIVGLESLHGTLREFFLVPRLGTELSARIGWPLGLVIVYATAWLTARWIGLTATASLLRLGVAWALLTFAFEIGIGLLRGYGWPRIFAEYNPLQGGLMGLGLVAMALAPLLAARLRKI